MGCICQCSPQSSSRQPCPRCPPPPHTPPAPQSRGGPNSWENLVACCSPCNSKKGDKSLSQLRWKLRQHPKEPSPHEMEVRAAERAERCRVQVLHVEWTLGARARAERVVAAAGRGGEPPPGARWCQVQGPLASGGWNQWVGPSRRGGELGPRPPASTAPPPARPPALPPRPRAVPAVHRAGRLRCRPRVPAHPVDQLHSALHQQEQPQGQAGGAGGGAGGDGNGGVTRSASQPPRALCLCRLLLAPAAAAPLLPRHVVRSALTRGPAAACAQ